MEFIFYFTPFGDFSYKHSFPDGNAPFLMVSEPVLCNTDVIDTIMNWIGL
jgi:hypothetical protein